MQILKGTAVAPGIARGKAFLYKAEVLRATPQGGESKDTDPQHADQHARIKTAMSDVRHGLETDASDISRVLDNDSGDIFRAQSAMMEDTSVMEELERYLGRGPIDAEEAVRAVFAIFANRFRGAKNEALRARGDDVEDLSRRLLLSLRGINAHRFENMPGGSVLVARQLFPSDTVFFSRSSTVAVVAEFAGPTAHAALLARELGIPCVGGITRIMELTHADDDIIVDGTKGLVFIDPDHETSLTYECTIKEGELAKHPPIQIDRKPTVTANGTEVAVMANAWSQEDVALAIRSGADGIGLFRTEPFFMASKHLPTANEFTEFLARCLEPVGSLRVNVRLLDVGADKNPIYLPLPPEPDPFMGLRGVRVLLRYPDLLEAQLRALLESSRRFNLGILIPMVTLDRDVVQVVDTCRKLAAAMGVKVIPQIGAMIETPAAALTIGSLVEHVDFLSIGSNDLTQYTLAAGRENASVTDYFIDDHPAVLRLMEIVIKDARATPVSLCGELAGKTKAIPELLRIGLHSLSVASSLLAEVRQTIQGTTVTGMDVGNNNASAIISGQRHNFHSEPPPVT
jgi:phosphoenolpyruvate-protein phosphotransferase